MIRVPTFGSLPLRLHLLFSVADTVESRLVSEEDIILSFRISRPDVVLDWEDGRETKPPVVYQLALHLGESEKITQPAIIDRFTAATGKRDWT